MVRGLTFLTALVAATGVLYLAGCGQSSTPSIGSGTPPALTHSAPTPGSTAVATKTDEHVHKAGAHSGIIVEIGRDNYHAEAVFEKGGTLRLFMLGSDEAKVQDVEAQSLMAYVKTEGTSESASFKLQAEPQPGDAEGKTSLFVGQIPQELAGKKLEVTIPSLRINSDRYRIAFMSVSEAHHEEAMPASDLADADEKALYLTAGGIYTQADIAANGNVTASQKFKGFVPKHDLKPKIGDVICPVTLTKANPECTWIVGGKKYLFCCPPCVEEFVKLAKENPKDVKDPAEYVKR